MPRVRLQDAAWRHRSVILAITLSSVAFGSLAVLVLLAVGLGGSFRAGPVRVTLMSFERPLAWGCGAAVWLLIQHWRRPAWRRLGITALAAFGLLAIVSFARATPPIITHADLAVTELYTELASRGRLLVGPYSRFGWHHPGPLYFLLQAPLYVLGGHQAAALYAGAVGINLAALMAVAWVTGRETRGWLPVLVTGACLLFAWRASAVLASPWTAHVPVVPSLAFCVLCAAVLSGRLRVLPLAMAVGGLVAQTFIAFVPLVGALSACVLVSVVLQGRNSGRPVLPVLSATAWTCLAVWLLPIAEALSHGGGNLAALWRFFVTSPAPGQALADVVSGWSYGLTGVLRPGFDLPWGGHFVPRQLWWAVPAAATQVLLLAFIAYRDFTGGRRFEASLAFTFLVASVVGFWALSRIRDDIVDHEIFWLAALGAANLAIIAAAGLRRAAEGWLPRSAAWERAAGAAHVALLLVGVAIGVHHLRLVTAFEGRRTSRVSIVRMHDAIRRYVHEHGIRKPLIEIRGAVWSDAAGVLLRLYRDGIPFAVPAAQQPMFTDAFAATGDEDAVVTIGPSQAREEEAPPHSAIVIYHSRTSSVAATRIH